MAAVVLSPLIKAILAFLGLGTVVAAAAAPTPKEAVRRRQLKRALESSSAPLRLLPSGGLTVVVDPSQTIGGSDASPVDPSSPPRALAEMDHLDSRWGPAVEVYRSLHDTIPSQQQILSGDGRSFRYPTRLAILRATIDALSHSDPFAAKFGESWAITDPTTGEMLPEWLEVVALYAPTQDEWEAVASQVEEFYSRPDAPGVLDYLRGLVATAGDAIALDWRGALRGAVRLSGMGDGDAPTLETDARLLSREELAILATLRAWTVQAQVETLTNSSPRKKTVGQGPRTAQESLSGGGQPLARGVASLGGADDVAARLRALPELQPLTRALSDDALTLKAALIARRWPTAGATSSGSFPSSFIPPPASSRPNAPTNTRPQTPPQDPNIRDQSQGSNIRSQYEGPQQ